MLQNDPKDFAWRGSLGIGERQLVEDDPRLAVNAVSQILDMGVGPFSEFSQIDVVVGIFSNVCQILCSPGCIFQQVELATKF